MKWRVKIYHTDPVAELEGESYFDFAYDIDAWRFRELAMKSMSVDAVTIVYRINY